MKKKDAMEGRARKLEPDEALAAMASRSTNDFSNLKARGQSAALSKAYTDDPKAWKRLSNGSK